MRNFDVFAGNLNQVQQLIAFTIVAFMIVLTIYFLFSITKEVIVNSISGFGLVLILQYFGIWDFKISLVVFLMILFGGVPGVVLIYLFHFLKISI